MRLQPDDKATDAPLAMRHGKLRGTMLAALVIVLVAAIGFVGFLWQLRGAEAEPARADGIVVLTGGASRVSDAIELLAGGYGKRLLISGVHPASAALHRSESRPASKTPARDRTAHCRSTNARKLKSSKYPISWLEPWPVCAAAIRLVAQ